MLQLDDEMKGPPLGAGGRGYTARPYYIQFRIPGSVWGREIYMRMRNKPQPLQTPRGILIVKMREIRGVGLLP